MLVSPSRKGRKVDQTYEIVTEKLHDEGGVLVALLGESVKLCRCVSSDPDMVHKFELHAPAIASSNEVLAIWQALSGELRIS